MVPRTKQGARCLFEFPIVVAKASYSHRSIKVDFINTSADFREPTLGQSDSFKMAWQETNPSKKIASPMTNPVVVGKFFNKNDTQDATRFPHSPKSSQVSNNSNYDNLKKYSSSSCVSSLKVAATNTPKKNISYDELEHASTFTTTAKTTALPKSSLNIGVQTALSTGGKIEMNGPASTTRKFTQNESQQGNDAATSAGYPLNITSSENKDKYGAVGKPLSLVDRLSCITGISRSFIDSNFSSIDNANLVALEHLFDGISSLKSVPLTTSDSHAIHDKETSRSKKIFLPKDHLIPSKCAISISISNFNDDPLVHIPYKSGGRGMFNLNALSNLDSSALFVFINDPIAALVVTERARVPAISIPSWMDDTLQLKFLASLVTNSICKIYLFTCSSRDNLDPILVFFSNALQRWRCHLFTFEDESNKPLWRKLQLIPTDVDFLSLLISKAVPLVSSHVNPMHKYLDQVRREVALGNKALWGTPLKWALPELTNITKGLRPGELTIFSGPTGSGKTTILSLFSLDWCEQNTPTLWGSFEIPNHRILKKMMIQHRGGQFSDDPDVAIEQFEIESKYFSSLPLHFMNFFGSSSPFSDVIDTMTWAVQQLGIKHVILDNLQFMTSGQVPFSPTSSFSRFDFSDRVLCEIRKFATEMDCHVTLVIHPRKEDDNSVLGIASVSGTAKATQEADNVLIIQKIGKRRYIDVRKNRFDGELGRIPYIFDSGSLRISVDPLTGDEEEVEGGGGSGGGGGYV